MCQGTIASSDLSSSLHTFASMSLPGCGLYPFSSLQPLNEQDLDAELSATTYLAGPSCIHATVADLLLAAVVRGGVAVLTLPERQNYPHLTRWFNLIQSLSALRGVPRVAFILNPLPAAAH